LAVALECWREVPQGLAAAQNKKQPPVLMLALEGAHVSTRAEEGRVIGGPDWWGPGSKPRECGSIWWIRPESSPDCLGAELASDTKR
jgi:hypothetical protein